MEVVSYFPRPSIITPVLSLQARRVDEYVRIALEGVTKLRTQVGETKCLQLITFDVPISL